MRRLPRVMRLARTRDFDGVFRAKVRTSAGPLVILAAPNDTGHCRLGLAISRRVGNAVRRNRIKRLVREAFQRMAASRPGMRHLSMGMSADFEIAIEEGATEVRVGTAIFGMR